MKDIFIQYASYNLWANQKFTLLINALDPSIQNQSVVSSFDSIRSTLHHMMFAENLWWQRMKLVESPSFFTEEKLEVSIISKNLIASSEDWKNWVSKASVNALEHEIIYHNTKKEQFKQPISQLLLHLFNHQSYHRGQLVTLLRQCGITSIPPTDFIVWSRTKKN